MRLRRELSNFVLLLVVNISTNYAWLLQSPRGVSIESINMRHVLKWRPLQFLCGTTVYYSVQFQGEFELKILNGSWVDAHECQQITSTQCDLTLDLGSDSNYNIHVRAQCGSHVSPWAKLGKPFNRRKTILTEPEMTVTAMGDALQVSFKQLPLTVGVSVTVWKRGEEHEASTQVIPAEQNPLHIAALQEGAVYCVIAHTQLDMQHTSSSTEPQCVTITGPGTPWMKPTTVSVVVVIMAGLLFTVFWSVIHCKPDACQAYFREEPLPYSLSETLLSVATNPHDINQIIEVEQRNFRRKQADWQIPRLKFPVVEAELCEPIHAVLLIGHHMSVVGLSEEVNE